MLVANQLFQNLDFPYLSSKTKSFVEVLLVDLFILLGSRGKCNERVEEVFARCRDAPDMAAGLRIFLRKTVMSSDLFRTSNERKLVKKGCRHAEKILKELAEDSGA